MATIIGQSSDQKVTTIYDGSSKKLWVYLPNYRVLIIEPSDLQPIIEALENLKQNMTAALGGDALK